MRALAIGVVLLVSLTGCAQKTATPFGEDAGLKPAEPTRHSYPPGKEPGSGGPPLVVDQDPKKYNLTEIARFQIRLPIGPRDLVPPAVRLWIGNESFVRITTTFFINSANPVNSGTGTVPLVGPLLGARPAMVANWDNGPNLVRQTMPNTLFFAPSIGGYTQVGAPQATIRPTLYYPTQVAFSSAGWGDIYARVVVEDAYLLNQTAPPGGSFR